MTKKQKTHQIYGPGAIRTACGRNTYDVLKTARPGKKVTCKTCNKVEAARQAAFATNVLRKASIVDVNI